MAANLTTLTKIHNLENRYPFKEEELEILVRAHEHLQDGSDEDSFLAKLALASPYSFFFLPGDAMRERISFIEDYVLPAGFPNQLRAAISSDSFVDYANEGDKALERLLEGVADTGRRGTKEALRVLYWLVDEPMPEEIADFVVRLSIASEALVVPNIDKDATLAQLEDFQPAVQTMAQSLEIECKGKPLTVQKFVEWAETKFPMLSTPLSTFVHTLLFHGHPYPEERIPYKIPLFDHPSDVFNETNSSQLLSLSYTSQHFGGKWHRLYSSFLDGRSFNRLEWAVLGYKGPTVLVIKTTGNSILGAFATSAWKEARDFYGSADCFLFQLDPLLRVHRPVGGDENFMYLHSTAFHSSMESDSRHGHPHGLGFGGNLSKPRLFIPESFEHCSADYLDKTFESGELLPMESLEKFEIKYLEVWGVGGDEVITQALRERAEHRERADNAILKARVVHDKSQFAKDMKSGLIASNIFSHNAEVRGRQEFSVDDVHGGYKIDLNSK